MDIIARLPDCNKLQICKFIYLAIWQWVYDNFPFLVFLGVFVPWWLK